MKCWKFIFRITVLFLALLRCEVIFAGPVFTGQYFIDAAAIRSISEIETAKIALDKSDSVVVKAYAQQVLEEQTGILDHLRNLAKVQKLRMMSDADLRVKAHTFVFLRKGKTFDQAYVDMRLAERRKSVSLFREAADMADGDIKRYAIDELPVLMHQLYMAQTLAGDVAKAVPVLADSGSHL